MTPTPPKRLMPWLGRHPLRTVLRIAAAVLGVGATGWLLGTVWPEPDQVAVTEPVAPDNPTNLAPLPLGPLTLLVVGLDADQIGDPVNNAAPRGRANADAVMLLQVESQQPLQVLQVPIELALQLPGQTGPVKLGSLWQTGGVALLSDAIGELVGLPADQPHRYVVLPRRVLRSLVDGLGDLDVILNASFQRRDQTQNYTVNLQAGRQSLNGSQAEQLARYLKDPLDDPNRRLRQQLLIRALLEQFRGPGVIETIPGLVDAATGDVETNLSKAEMLSLAAAVLSSPASVKIKQLPLAKRAGKQVLRQIKAGESLPLWPRP